MKIKNTSKSKLSQFVLYYEYIPSDIKKKWYKRTAKKAK